MSHWELDSTLFLSSRLPDHTPAEEAACVLCADPTSGDQPQTVCVVDVNPTSRFYGEVAREIALDQDVSTGNASAAAGASEPGTAHRIAPRVLLAHDPTCPYGFVSSGFSLHNLSSAISVWRRYDGPEQDAPWALRKVIAIPDEPAGANQLPALLRPVGAIPALITDIALSPDDRFLYIACWGTGDLKQFDVSNPLRPREVASVRIGGVASRAAHPSQAQQLTGGPATVTVSRDGRRIYLTNSLSRSWDTRLYPDGLRGWMVKLDADPAGGLAFDPNFFVDFGDQRPQEVRLPGQGRGERVTPPGAFQQRSR
ncbi:MAG: selenium-binding protein SBP56-related protein [Thermomicrobiales bacterium]